MYWVWAKENLDFRKELWGFTLQKLLNKIKPPRERRSILQATSYFKLFLEKAHLHVGHYNQYHSFVSLVLICPWSRVSSFVLIRNESGSRSDITRIRIKRCKIEQAVTTFLDLELKMPKLEGGTVVMGGIGFKSTVKSVRVLPCFQVSSDSCSFSRVMYEKDSFNRFSCIWDLCYMWLCSNCHAMIDKLNSVNIFQETCKLVLCWPSRVQLWSFQNSYPAHVSHRCSVQRGSVNKGYILGPFKGRTFVKEVFFFTKRFADWIFLGQTVFVEVLKIKRLTSNLSFSWHWFLKWRLFQFTWFFFNWVSFYSSFSQYSLPI